MSWQVEPRNLPRESLFNFPVGLGVRQLAGSTDHAEQGVIVPSGTLQLAARPDIPALCIQVFESVQSPCTLRILQAASIVAR